MKTTLIGSAILSLMMLSGPVAAQAVYKWVDENGITSYGETPPSYGQAVRTDVVVRRTDPVAVQARADEQQAVKDAVDTRKRNEETAATETTSQKAEEEKARKENCRLALDRQTKYDQAHRLYRASEGGGREYLSDAELDNERAEANRQVNEWCSKK